MVVLTACYELSLQKTICMYPLFDKFRHSWIAKQEIIYVITKPKETYDLWTQSCITQHEINISLMERITKYFQIYFVDIVAQVCGSML